jgi:hypothetical protein
VQKLDIKCINFKKLHINYGPKQLYKIQFEWSKELKCFDLSLGINMNYKMINSKFNHSFVDSTNPHMLFINEIKKQFAKDPSVLNLIHMLNNTFCFSYALNKLLNIPRINSKIVLNQAAASFSSFMVVIYSLNHVRLTFHSKYWVDIQLKANGQLTFRDSCFDQIDSKKEYDQANILRFLKVTNQFYLKIPGLKLICFFKFV